MQVFKATYDLDARLVMSIKARTKYPEQVPCLVVARASKKFTKMIVPRDYSIGAFLIFLRRNAQIRAEDAFYIFVNNTLPSVSSTMGQLYDDFSEEDGFLYIFTERQSSFG